MEHLVVRDSVNFRPNLISLCMYFFNWLIKNTSLSKSAHIFYIRNQHIKTFAWQMIFTEWNITIKHLDSLNDHWLGCDLHCTFAAENPRKVEYIYVQTLFSSQDSRTFVSICEIMKLQIYLHLKSRIMHEITLKIPKLSVLLEPGHSP